MQSLWCHSATLPKIPLVSERDPARRREVVPEGEQVILGQDLLEVMGVLIVAFVRVYPAALTRMAK